MTAADLDRLCAEATKRLNDYIARCAGQHLRRMRAGWIRRSKTQ
jgi:hypothetical protein